MPSEEREERAETRAPPQARANHAAAATRRAPPRRGSSRAPPSQAPPQQAASGAPEQAAVAAGGGAAAGNALVPIVVTNPGFRHPPRPPRYPASAIARGLEGTVLVRALIAPDGSTVEIKIERSSGVTLLDRAALDAVRGWAFRPASVGGRAVPAWVEVPVRFRLG